jgi:cold shock CspA family protein
MTAKMTASKIPSSPVRTVTMPTPVEKLSFASNEKDKDMQVKIETSQKLDAKVKEEKMQVKIEIAQDDKKPQPDIINGIEYIRRSESQSTTATTRESFTNENESLESASYRSRQSRNVGHVDLTNVDDPIDLTGDIPLIPYVGMKRKLEVILIT